MASPWEDPIKNSKQLTVFPTTALARSIWGPIFKKAITEFNGLAASRKLGVALVESTTAPDPDDETGANIQCDIANGTAKARGMGKDISTPFSGTGLHGLTEVLARSFGNNPARVVKCFVFVPARPLVHPGLNQAPRTAGDGVKLFIMVHEFVHAAGQLDNREHSSESNPDVFVGIPQASPTIDSGSKPQDDKVRVGAFPNFTRFPPITLSARTAGLIQPNWT
jgi:hypothetical protein